MKRLLLLIAVSALLTTFPLEIVAAVASGPQSERVRSDAQPSAQANGTLLELRNPGSEPVKFQIYSITGQLIKSIMVKTVYRLELPKGFYIVKCDSWTKRVMLK